MAGDRAFPAAGAAAFHGAGHPADGRGSLVFLYSWNGYGYPTQWVGWRNYQLIFRNSAFTQAIINNGLIVLVSLGVQIPLALWLATMVSTRIKGALFFRLIFFLPYVLAEVAAGMIWRFVYDGDFGLVAGVSHFLGVEAPFWLADRNVAMYAILGVIVWKYFGFHMMLFIAGLQAELLEAFQQDDLPRARAVNDRIYPLASVFYSAPWVDMHNRMKEALVMLGKLPRSVVRPPLMPLGDHEKQRIRAALLASGLLR